MKSDHAADGRVRPAPPPAVLTLLVGPALLVVAVFFGGGLVLGLGQVLADPQGGITLDHLRAVIGSPDFLQSLLATVYVCSTSTVIAAALALACALYFHFLAAKSRVVRFLFQVPLATPHLVITMAVLFLLAPSGFFERLMQAAGLVGGPAAFPVLTNDPFSIGVMAAYVWKETPFITLMVMSGLANAGAAELLEVGRTLKAGRLARLRLILLPVVLPSLGAASLIVFAYTFGAYEVPYLLGRTWPRLLPVWAYLNFRDPDLAARPEGVAAGLVIAVICAVAVVVSQVVAQTSRKKGVVL